MSGTSLDAVDAALILTDGEQVFEFGATAERKYLPEERRILQVATDAARSWNWSGPQPEEAFDAAKAVVTQTHAETMQHVVIRLVRPGACPRWRAWPDCVAPAAIAGKARRNAAAD